MAGSIKGITIEIEGKTSGLVKSLNDVNKSLKMTQDSLKTVNKALKLDPKNLDTLKTKQGLLNTAIDETKQKLEMEKQVAQDAAKALEEGTITKGQYDALQAEVAKTTAELKSLEEEAQRTNQTIGELGGNTSGLKSLGSAIQSAGSQIESLGTKVKAVGDNMQQLGGNLTKSVTAPIVAVGKTALDSFNEVDGAMDTVIKKTGATGAEADKLNDLMKELATSSDIAGTSFDEASVAVGEINTRFGATGDELKDLSKEFIKFAKINDTDLNGSIDSVQKALTSFGMDVKDAGTLMDVLTKESQKTGISVDTLASGLISNSAAFQEMGMSAYQAADFMAQVEVSGADVSTVMSSMQKALKKSVSEGKTMNEALTELENTIKSGTGDMDGLTAAYDLFGKSGANVYEAVKNGTINFTDLASSFSIVNDSAGAVSQTFEATQDGIDQMTSAQNSLKTAMSDIGEVIGETVAPMLQKLSEAIKGVSEWWKTLNPETQQFIVKAAMLAAVLGPVLIILGSLISSIGSIITVVGGAVTGIGGLITTLGAGGGLAAVLSGTVVPAITGFLAAAAPIAGVIAGVVAAVVGVIAIFQNWGAITEWLSGVWEGFKTFISDTWNGIKELASSIWSGITDTISNAVTSVGSFISSSWEGIKSNVSATWDSIKAGASEKWNAITSSVSSTIESMKSGLSSKWESIKSTASSTWEAIKSGISDKASAIKTAAVNAIEGAKSGIKSVVSDASSWGADMMSNLSSGISGAVSRVKNAVSNVAGIIRSFLHFTEPDIGPLADFHTYMPDMIDMMTKGMMSGVPKVETAATQLGTAVHDGVTDYSGQLGTINQSIKGMQLSTGDTTVYVQISDSQLQRAVAKVIKGDSLRSGGR